MDSQRQARIQKDMQSFNLKRKEKMEKLEDTLSEVTYILQSDVDTKVEDALRVLLKD